MVPEPANIGRKARVALLLVVLAAAFAWRWQFVDVPLERDEGEYAYFGQLVRHGGVPYIDAHHMKLPGVYFVYAAAFLVLPESERSVRLVATIAHLASAVFLYGIARRWFSPIPSLLATAAFTALASGIGILGFAAKAEHFVLAFALAGLCVLLCAGSQPSLAATFCAGVLLGSACLMKQSAVLFLLPAWYAAALPPAGRAVALRSAVLVIGAATPLILLALLLLRWEAWEPFWFWAVVYAREYARGLPWAEGLAQFRRSLGYVASDAPALWLAAPVGAALLLRPGAVPRRGPLWVLVAASAASVVLGWRFSEHYFLLLAPAAALLNAALAEHRLHRHAWFGAAFLTSAVLTSFHFAWQPIRSLDPEQMARFIYQANPFPEAREVGRLLREHTHPGERLAVLGSEPQVYFYARRRAATRFVYMYPLMERHPYARRMQEELIAELERSQPRYAVLVHVPSSWSVQPHSERLIFDWSADWVNRWYRLVGLVRMDPNGPSWVYWGEEAAAQPRGETYIAVFERR